MDIMKEREKANEIIAEYERICETLEDGMTYELYAEINGATPVPVVMYAREQLQFLDKVEAMEKDELEKITSIPVYQDDMREVKDIKDKYGFTWSQMKMLRGGVVPPQGERLKTALKDAGLTQTEYCKRSGISLRTFQHWVHEDTAMPGWMLRLVLKDIAELGKIGVDTTEGSVLKSEPR